MAISIYQVQIALKGSKPKIWRRLLIPSDLLLSDFHKIIQDTMGWFDSHLHQFAKNRKFYSVKDPDDDFWDEFNNADYKKQKIRISDLLKTENEKITYEYDFGDGWIHDIILEKMLPPDPEIKYPACIAGARNCPPEDVGGIWGYAEMLKILKQPDHAEYKNYLEWLGEDFDPEYFDLKNVNKLLSKKKYKL
jgi:hypothetical protein